MRMFSAGRTLPLVVHLDTTDEEDEGERGEEEEEEDEEEGGREGGCGKVEGARALMCVLSLPSDGRSPFVSSDEEGRTASTKDSHQK